MINSASVRPGVARAETGERERPRPFAEFERLPYALRRRHAPNGGETNVLGAWVSVAHREE